MGDAAGQASDGLHFLSLAELLFESAALGDVLGKEFKENFFIFVADGPPGDANDDGAAVLAFPFCGHSGEGLQGAEVVGEIILASQRSLDPIHHCHARELHLVDVTEQAMSDPLAQRGGVHCPSVLSRRGLRVPIPARA